MIYNFLFIIQSAVLDSVFLTNFLFGQGTTFFLVALFGNSMQGPLITDGRNSNEILFLPTGLWKDDPGIQTYIQSKVRGRFRKILWPSLLSLLLKC